MIYTIGYGRSDICQFIRELKAKDIKVLVDVRSVPIARYGLSFTRGYLEEILEKEGISYLFKGEKLGGFGYTDEHLFLEGIDELVELQKENNIVIMCSESDYRNCHRYQKITPRLVNKDIKVVHLAVGKKNSYESCQKTLLTF